LLTSVPVASWLSEGIQNEGSLLGTIWMVVGKPLCLSMILFFLQLLTDEGGRGMRQLLYVKTQGPTTAVARSGYHAVEPWRNGEVITVSL
jgi:hypothetical protein